MGNYDNLIDKIRNRDDYGIFFKNEMEETYFKNKLKEFSVNISGLESEKKDAEKNIEKWLNEIPENEKSDLDEELKKSSDQNASKQKHYDRNITIFAGGGLSFIAILLIFSTVCASTNFCVVEVTEEIDGVYQTNKKQTNLPLQILESQFMIVLVGTVIAPVIVRVLKEKYDLQVEVSQISMIMQDAISTVKMYSKEANKLRDDQGKLSESAKQNLRNLAFSSLKSNYTAKKYASLISNVGVQVFDKAIENAVQQGKLERLPLEKEQILAIFKQSIDALPQIVEWQNLDPSIKEQFIKGHIRKLLSNVGIEGWAHRSLEEYFDAEVNQRLLAAALADKKTILDKLDDQNRYLKYTSIVVDAVSDSLAHKDKP